MMGSPASGRYALWTTRDRLAWEGAAGSTTAGFFDDRPRLAEWAPSTRRNARHAVNALLRWLRGESLLPSEGSLADAVTPDILLAFVRDQLPSHTPDTIANSVWLIIGALQLFAPDRNWDWITKIVRRLKVRARRQVPSPRPVVHAAVLYDLGLQIMRDSWPVDGDLNPSLYRSGLVITLLAAAPMRIANFAMLEIGRHLRQEGDCWLIRLSAQETKTRRADVWPITGQLARGLSQYITVVRPALRARALQSDSTSRLWIGDSGYPIGDQVLRRIIATFTHERIGIRITPHTFRHCAATTYAVERPRDELRSSALLGHASPQTTEKHYIVQQRQLVQHDYLRLLQARSCSAEPLSQ